MCTGGRDKAGILEWLKDPHPPETTPTGSEEASEEVWSEMESEVVHLTDATFDEVMSASPSALVMFYAPWCGHCKAIKPAYAEAAAAMKEQDIPGALVAVDATKETELSKRFSVSGYPTLRYFAGGVLQYDYGYGRTAEDIVNFMKSPKEPPPPAKEWAEEESAVSGCGFLFIAGSGLTLVSFVFVASHCAHLRSFTIIILQTLNNTQLS